MSKTNAIRILESRGIRHGISEYEVNEDELDAVSVARKIGADPETVFKTLVTVGDRTGYTVFVIPGSSELDLKKAAHASGNRKVEMIRMKDLLPVTGYIRGGCSPVGMKKLFPTYIDETAQLYEEIHVSAGVRGMQVRLSPPDLLKAVNAEFADLTGGHVAFHTAETMIRYKGVTATDTHQQESEWVQIDLTITSESVTGVIGTAFGSVYLSYDELTFSNQEFQGNPVSKDDSGSLYRLSVIEGTFACHTFTAKNFFLMITAGKYAYLSESPEGLKVTLWKA